MGVHLQGGGPDSSQQGHCRSAAGGGFRRTTAYSSVGLAPGTLAGLLGSQEYAKTPFADGIFQLMVAGEGRIICALARVENGIF